MVCAAPYQGGALGAPAVTPKTQVDFVGGPPLFRAVWLASCRHRYTRHRTTGVEGRAILVPGRLRLSYAPARDRRFYRQDERGRRVMHGRYLDASESPPRTGDEAPGGSRGSAAAQKHPELAVFGMQPEPQRTGGVAWTDQADRAMARYATGDDSAFGPLYDALSPRLYAFLARQVRCLETARDILQQTFLRLHATKGKFVPGKSVAAYAFAIGRRLCIDVMRRTRPEIPLPEDDAGAAAQVWLAENNVEGAIDAKVALRLVDNEFRRWSCEHRQVFELVHSEGLSHAEVAAIVGTTTNAIKLRMSRLKASLEAALHAADKD